MYLLVNRDGGVPSGKMRYTCVCVCVSQCLGARIKTKKLECTSRQRLYLLYYVKPDASIIQLTALRPSRTDRIRMQVLRCSDTTHTHTCTRIQERGRVCIGTSASTTGYSLLSLGMAVTSQPRH